MTDEDRWREDVIDDLRMIRNYEIKTRFIVISILWILLAMDGLLLMAIIQIDGLASK